jgi:hypothetical protein
MIGFSEREISKATASLNDFEQQALNLEKNEVIQKLYSRAYVAAAAESKYDLAKLLEEKRNSFERPPSPTKKQETIKETKTPIALNDERKLLNMLTSKRIAAVISIVLCAVLYLSFLSAFTTKRDTYICYTTKTGECFHSATCNYLNTAYETTVYEASRKYKPCNYCNPCVEQYKTTITSRNYIIPFVISVPISATVFVLLAYKKKK